MIFERINKLFEYFFQNEVSKEGVIKFQKNFEDIFSSFRDEIEAEIGTENYELLDEIYLAFDSYEPDENIRTFDKHCIDEGVLVDKIIKIYKKIDVTKILKE